MLTVLAMPFSKKLKIILQSKRFVIISLILLIFYILICTKVITYQTKIKKDTKELSGQIISYTIDGNKLKMLIKGQEKVQVTYYINTKEEKEYLEDTLLIGAKVDLEGSLQIPYDNTIPNTFNYKGYLYNNKIYVTFVADKIKADTKTSFLNQIKTKFMKRINQASGSSAYLYALILGETDYIENDIYQDYQENGTTHLFAVSGMHISALVLFLTVFFKKIHLKEGIGNVLIILFLFFYMFLIGFTPSVLRGGLLFLFLLINHKLKLNLNTLNILYLLFIVLILWNPFYIYNLGFIYSFTTSFGLILFSKKITGNALAKLAKTSTIAFLFSFPITIYNFYEINLLTILNNIIIVPFITSFIFPLSLLTFLLPILDPLLSLGIHVLEWISHFLNLFAINIVVPKINWFFIIFYYLVIYMIYKYHIKYSFFLILLVFFFKITPYINPNTYIYFLDVGQGDSTIIVGSHLRKVIMIDTGGKITYEEEEWEKKNKTYKSSDNIITFLKSIGITKIDTLIGTHGDYDHIGEAKNLINQFKVDKVILNQGEYNDLELELISELKKKKIEYFQNKTELNQNKIKLYFINNEQYDNENDNSIVIYSIIEGFQFLLMGDAGIEVEKDLLNKYNLKNINLLKVGHHGSKTSTSEEFIKEINPQYSIISVGRKNRYGHPNKEVLENLKNTKIFRTDQDGSIVIKIMKHKLNIETIEP